MAIPRTLFEDDTNLNPIFGGTNQNQQFGSVGALQPPVQPKAPSIAKPQVKGTLSQSLAPALGGLQAGQSVAGATDTTEALVGIGGATAAGALSGAAVGGVPGAVVGGAVGLLTSAINAWMSVKKENKRKRETQKLIKEVEAKQKKAAAIARKDSLLKLRFDRKDTERTNAINAFKMKRQMLTDAINSNQNLKDRFIRTGVR